MTSTQVKALIRNLARDKRINAQILLRNYMLERLLERISLSKYKNNFILKGGMLVAAMVGLDARSTIDMDATVKGYPLSEEHIKSVFDDILAINANDGVLFTIKAVSAIRDEADYAGIRITLEAALDEARIPLKVDITTGDAITPHEVVYKFTLLLENRTIDIYAYNLETVLAEKLETVISRGTANTRMRDYYDIYILSKIQTENIDADKLKAALTNTAERRGTGNIMIHYDLDLSEINDSETLVSLWNRYRSQYAYAADITWPEIMKSVRILFETIHSQGR
jgi:predicted nucleotidyltransferase component of viral defense system